MFSSIDNAQLPLETSTFVLALLLACGRRAKDSNQPGRDEFLRPMVDATGIKYRIGFSEEEVTEEIREEFEENQQESWAGLRFGGGHPPSPHAGCSMQLWLPGTWSSAKQVPTPEGFSIC